MIVLNIIEIKQVSGGLDPAIVNKPISEVTISEALEVYMFLELNNSNPDGQPLFDVFPWLENCNRRTGCSF